MWSTTAVGDIHASAIGVEFPDDAVIVDALFNRSIVTTNICVDIQWILIKVSLLIGNNNSRCSGIGCNICCKIW